MSFDPVAATSAYHAVLDALDLDAVEGWFAPDATYTSAGLGTLAGRDNIMAAMRRYVKRSPDHKAWDDSVRKVTSLVAVADWRLTATNIETGEKISRQGLETLTFTPEGKIISILVEDR